MCGDVVEREEDGCYGSSRRNCVEGGVLVRCKLHRDRSYDANLFRAVWYLRVASSFGNLRKIR